MKRKANKRKPRAQKSADEKFNLHNYKATDGQFLRIMQNAHKYADGNTSAWIRAAAQNYKPKRGEKIV